MIIRALRTFALTSGSSSSAITIKSDCIQPSDICRRRNSSGRPCRLMRQALQIWLNSKSESRTKRYLTNQDSIFKSQLSREELFQEGVHRIGAGHGVAARNRVSQAWWKFRFEGLSAVAPPSCADRAMLRYASI